MEEQWWGGGGREKIWMIQQNFYESHCFFPVHLRVEVFTSLSPLSLFRSCNYVTWTDICINQGLYTT